MGCLIPKNKTEDILIVESGTTEKNEIVNNLITINKNIMKSLQSAKLCSGPIRDYSNTKSFNDPSQANTSMVNYESMLHYNDKSEEIKIKEAHLIPNKKGNKIFFSDVLLKEINLIRTNPHLYAAKLENMIQYIRPNNNKKYTQCDYILAAPNCDKVSLPTGEKAFRAAIDFLKHINKPLKELEWCKEIVVDFPDDIDDFHQELLHKLIKEKRKCIKNRYPNFSVSPDVITDPEISAALQIVDDNTFQGQRRDTILNPDFVYFGVSQAKDNKKKLFTLISFA